MISFKEFLLEDGGDKPYKKKALTENMVKKLLFANCSDFLNSCAKTPIVRGMSRANGTDAKTSYLVQGDTGLRSSRNTSNFYTIILDEFLPEMGFPKRSKSLIAGTFGNRNYAFDYGWPFALIPYDGVPIGVCEYKDIFETDITLGEKTLTIYEWNEIYERAKLSDASFNAFKKSFLKALRSNINKEFDEYFSPMKSLSDEEVIDALRNMYVDHFKVADSTDIKHAINGSHEVWIGGKCLAIPYEEYLNIIKEWSKDKDITT